MFTGPPTLPPLLQTMLLGYSPLAQTAMGTAVTWGVTALGASLCVFQQPNRRTAQKSMVLEWSLGFSAGVMLAASFWSLLQPAITLAEAGPEQGGLAMGRLAFLPAAIGFSVGALFILITDILFPEQNVLVLPKATAPTAHAAEESWSCNLLIDTEQTVRRRMNDGGRNLLTGDIPLSISSSSSPFLEAQKPKLNNRLWLLLLAITIHNFPEGMAVGAAFGQLTNTTSIQPFHRARNLAVGIAIQNFPEGLAVSLPLRAAGYSFWDSFWYGQFSGFVEPIAGLLGCLAVQHLQQLQPYTLGFAAGAMIFVILDDVIPEAHQKGHGRGVSILACLGFLIMMALDVGFG